MEDMGLVVKDRHFCSLMFRDVRFFLHFVYFHSSKVKVRFNFRCQVFKAGIVSKHVQIQLLCN